MVNKQGQINIEPIIDSDNPVAICDVVTVRNSALNVRISCFADTHELRTKVEKAKEEMEKTGKDQVITAKATATIQTEPLPAVMVAAKILEGIRNINLTFLESEDIRELFASIRKSVDIIETKVVPME